MNAQTINEQDPIKAQYHEISKQPATQKRYYKIPERKTDDIQSFGDQNSFRLLKQ